MCQNPRHGVILQVILLRADKPAPNQKKYRNVGLQANFALRHRIGVTASQDVAIQSRMSVNVALQQQSLVSTVQ